MARRAAQMREPAYFLLLSLLDGPLHGDAIIELTEELSRGRVRLATGALYAELDRLIAQGQVDLVREEIVNGRVRRSYGLTPQGASALEAEAGPLAVEAEPLAVGAEPLAGAAEPMMDAARLVTELPPGGERESPEGEPRESSLERRCRWLLLAYPAWYRRKETAEMLGTLLVTSPPGRQWPSVRDARSLLLAGTRVRGWVWRLSALWVVIGAGAAGYGFVCALQGCTTNQCTNDEFLFPIYNGEPWLLADVGALAATAWVLLAVPLLLAGFVRLRGWQRRNWLRTTAWAGAWFAAFVLMLAVVVVGGLGADHPGGAVGWGEWLVFAAWLGLGAVVNQILSTPARSRDVPAAL